MDILLSFHSRGGGTGIGSGMKVGNGIERTENDQPRMYWSSNLYRRVGLLFDRIYSNEDYDNNDCDDSER